MKTCKLIIAFLLLGAAGLSAAGGGGHAHFYGHPHHSHAVVSFGFVAGPIWGPWYYPPPYYNSPVVVEQVAPPVYIERQAPELASAQAGSSQPGNYWYYCEAADGYYPYVKECRGGWQKVAPQPPAGPDLDRSTR